MPIPCSQFYEWMIVEDAPEPTEKTMETLTIENARTGLYVQFDGNPKVPIHTLAQRIKDGKSEWVLCRDGKASRIREEYFGNYAIVEDASEPPLVEKDRIDPRHLPEGHPDAPQRTLQAIDGLCCELRNRLKYIQFATKPPCESVGVKASNEWATEGLGLVEQIFALIGNEGNSVNAEPSRTLQAIDGLLDAVIDRMDGLASKIEKDVGGGWQVIAGEVQKSLNYMRALIGNKYSSVGEKPVKPEALSLVDEVISILEIVTNRTMPQTVDPKLLKHALEFQYQLRGVLTPGPAGETPRQELSNIVAALAALNVRLIDEYDKLYGTGEVAAESEAEVQDA